MGLTKQYRRYEPSAVFGVIGSQKSNVLFLELQGVKGKFCAVGACENVMVWDLKKGEKVLALQGDKEEVTRLASSPGHSHLAVGYNDGSIKVFNLATGELQVTFNGHKSAVTALNYDQDGVRLVSGSKDTEIIVWDIVNECGQFRLKGHKGMVTQARFFAKKNLLVTSSKDTFVKFWDLDTQHCFKTLVGHKSEVWDFVLIQEENRLITGTTDTELRVWQMQFKDQDEESDPPLKKPMLDKEDDEEEEESSVLSCTKVGSLMRHGRDRVLSMSVDSTGCLLGCHGSDTSLELFRICSKEEVKKHLAKRLKRARKRLREAGEGEEKAAAVTQQSVEDEIQRSHTFKAAAKIRAFDLLMESGEETKVICLLNNNVLQSCSVNPKEAATEVTVVSKLHQPGHRSDVRTLCFSSDNTAVLSASAESIKVWNRSSLQCIRTIDCDYALSSLFVPGDRHVILGTKSGKLQLFDIAEGSLLESVKAHEGAVWSIALAPDKKSIISGSADKTVKFWNFELVADEEYSKTKKRLTLEHSRTLQMNEDVLCVKYSPNSKLVVVSLLDNTVKAFFADTLKFFLSLYGHKLPVLCMDISSDSSLIVTGSADRNVKIWGLDFGDCHKSIFAHDDSIMCVQFIPKTHMFFTAGKDKKVKQWDADNFENILTLQGHHSEVWCLAISPSGNFVVSGAHDKSLRLWEKTEEPLVLEEEREMEREKEYDNEVGKGEESVIAGETNQEAALAGKKTVETVKAAEKLMEALELHKEESLKLREHQAMCKAQKKQVPPPVNLILQAFGMTSPDKYVLHILKQVKSSELEESLLVLPFAYVGQLLSLLNMFISYAWEVELCCRCLFFLLRVHHGQISSTEMLLPIMEKLKANTTQQVTLLKDQVGFNLSGLQFLKQQIEEKDEVKFFMDATDRFQEKKKKAKKRAILAIHT